MIQRLMNTMRLQAQMAGNSAAVTRVGLVDAYDPNTYAVKVMLQPEGVLTGWLPLLSPWVGNQWGIFAPPTIGDMVEVHFQEDDPDVGFVGQRFYNDSDRPLPAPSGEFWLVHKSGSLLKFHNDGSVELTTNQDLNATVGRNANVTASGNITTTSTGGTVVNAAGIKLKGGGADTGIVQGSCLCSFTGAPHPQISATVTGTP